MLFCPAKVQLEVCQFHLKSSQHCVSRDVGKINEFDFIVEISNFASLFKVQVWSEKEILMFH